jgi:hypothetical protein
VLAFMRDGGIWSQPFIYDLWVSGSVSRSFRIEFVGALHQAVAWENRGEEFFRHLSGDHFAAKWVAKNAFTFGATSGSA